MVDALRARFESRRVAVGYRRNERRRRQSSPLVSGRFPLKDAVVGKGSTSEARNSRGRIAIDCGRWSSPSGRTAHSCSTFRMPSPCSTDSLRRGVVVMSGRLHVRRWTEDCGSLRLPALANREGSEWARFDSRTFATSLGHLQEWQAAYLQVRGPLGHLGAAGRKVPHPRSTPLKCSR